MSLKYCLQQDLLVVQLQEQHFQQYMQQVHTQQIAHQRQQYTQMQALASSTQTGGTNAPVVPMTTSLDGDQQQLVQFMTETDGKKEDRDPEIDESSVTDQGLECQISATNDAEEKLIVAENAPDDSDGHSNIDEDDHCKPL